MAFSLHESSNSVSNLVKGNNKKKKYFSYLYKINLIAISFDI